MQNSIRSQIKEESSRLVGHLAETYGENAGCHLVEGEVLESIMAQVDTLNASILILGERNVGGSVRHLLLGVITERLMRLSLCPVLIVKRPPREAYRSVIVPIDFSPWSLRAIHLAQAVAPDAKFILLHAYEIPFEDKMRATWEKEKTIRRYRDIAHRKADDRLRQTAVDTGISAANCNFIVARGNPISLILDQEDEQGADLIVLGKHGLGMTEELLLGGRTKQVATQALCDVLVADR